MNKKIKTILLLLFLTFYTAIPSAGVVLKAGISLSDKVPKGFFGSWKITSVMTYSNNDKIFNEITTDYWNLSKHGDVITLSNPFSGAESSVKVEEVAGNQIKFTHITQNSNAKMIETPVLTLNGENFYGTDKIIIERYKYGTKVSTDVVIYKITATKLNGSSLNELLSRIYTH